MSIHQPIFSHKKISKYLCDNNIHTIQDGRKILSQLFIFMELEQFSYYFVSTKTLSWSNEKWKLVYLNQYLPRKTPQALQEQDINPLQHGIYFGIFFIYFYMWRQFSLSLGFRYFSFVFFYPFLSATTVYISVTNTRVQNTPYHDIYQEFLFFYTSIHLILEWYPPRYEWLIAMTCYFYTIYTHFEDQTRLKTEI